MDHLQWLIMQIGCMKSLLCNERRYGEYFASAKLCSQTLSFAGIDKYRQKTKRKTMRKLIMAAVALACATVIMGCGKGPHEKIVGDFCSVWQSRNVSDIDAFVKDKFAYGELDASLKGSAKEYLKQMAKSKESIKTKVYRKASDGKMDTATIGVAVEGKGMLFFSVIDGKIYSICTDLDL